jgi:sortase A
VNRRRALTILLALGGLLLVGRGLWIPAKALLAQVLLEDAWTTAQAEGTNEKPWPWADTWPVARLTHGDDVDLLVLAGATGRTMAFGPGHLLRSSPINAGGNVVIAAHRDTHFRFLEHVGEGDTFTVEDKGGQRVTYAVTEIGVMHKDDTRATAEEPSAVLTLVTCYPFDAVVPGGPLRFVVRAERAL